MNTIAKEVRKTRVLEINTVCGIRSTGRICTDLADFLHAQGHECEIAYGREEVPEKYQNIAYRIGNQLDVNIHALASRIFDCVGFCSKQATKKLIAHIDEFQPDVIHLHNLHGYYINVEILFQYLKTKGIPVVWTLHDCWAFTGHCAHFHEAGCERWKTGCYKCPLRKVYPSCVGFDRSKENWKSKNKLFTSLKKMEIVTPSQWLANLVKASFLKDSKVNIIPNGVDLSVFQSRMSDFREKYSLENKKIILGVATAWSDNKGLNEFVKLAELVDDYYKIVMVGIQQKLKDRIPANVLTIPLTNNVYELAEIYSAADVFVNASREETMGLTTVEAMACGTPVVVSNLTAVPEVVTAQSGIVIKNLTAEEILQAVEDVLKQNLDPCENAVMYEKKKQYQKYLDLYKRVIEEND